MTLCQNELPYTHDGITIPTTALTTANYDTITYTNSYGCDSNAVISLVILQLQNILIDTILCHGIEFTWNSMAINSTGEYVFNTTNMNGCDSIVTLSIRYTNEPLNVDEQHLACGSIFLDGFTITKDNNYIDTIMNSVNCDSMYRYVNVKIKSVIYDTLQHDICEGEIFNFNDIEYNEAGIYTQQFTNGCDSLITLQLTISELPEISFYPINTEDFCVGDTITLEAMGAEKYMFYDIYDNLLIQHSNNSVLVRMNYNQNEYSVIGTNE